MTTSPASETPETNRVMELAEALKPGTVVVRVAHARSLERRLREAEAHVKELRGRFQLCNEERERQHTRAEAAERGEGMVMVSRSQIEEVIGMAQRFKDIGRRSPHKARMSILEAKLTGWLSAAEEGK